MVNGLRKVAFSYLRATIHGKKSPLEKKEGNVRDAGR